MAEHLPREIIREIILCNVDPEAPLPDMFNLYRDVPPFRPKALAYLAVSKAWHGATVSIVYRTIVLRTKRQAEALATTVHRDYRLGHYIRNLMFCGGFGRASKTILTSATNLHTIAITLHIQAKDSVLGLLSGLRLVNPAQLIVRPHRPH
ncbi:hypothetical protein B0H15DRAFT_764997, partial [Mycena belliarum]